MFNKKMVSHFILFSALSVLLIGCGFIHKKKIEATEPPFPNVFKQLMETKYAYSINGVGRGVDFDSNIAIKKARLDAQNQLANAFRNEFTSLKKMFNIVEKQESLVDVCFPKTINWGLSEAKKITAIHKDGYTTHVLMTIPAVTLKEFVDQELQLHPNEKENETYKELKIRVDSDKVARSGVQNESN